MATYTKIKVKGRPAIKARVRKKQNGKLVFDQSKTFLTRTDAARWARETETRLDVAEDPAQLASRRADSLADIINRYIKTVDPIKPIRRQDVSALNNLAADRLGSIPAERLTAHDVADFATRKRAHGAKAGTVTHYLFVLKRVLEAAPVLFGINTNIDAFERAHKTLLKTGIAGRADKRERRPTRDELNRILTRLADSQTARIPAATLVVFAIFSTRRASEITRLRWQDYDRPGLRVWVRAMKHPREKRDTQVELTQQAADIIDAQPKIDARIFPYKSESMTAAFQRACKDTGVDDLRFHDLRHEGISRLFELGLTIPQVAKVSGHLTWTSLQRYAHLETSRPLDRYAGWRWLDYARKPSTYSARSAR